MKALKRVIVESPYAGDIGRNIRYARRCMRDSILRGEAPIASHLIYTQIGILDDDDPMERALGITCGFSWSSVAELHAFYLDLGWSRGMEAAREFCQQNNRPFETRYLEPKE